MGFTATKLAAYVPLYAQAHAAHTCADLEAHPMPPMGCLHFMLFGLCLQGGGGVFVSGGFATFQSCEIHTNQATGKVSHVRPSLHSNPHLCAHYWPDLETVPSPPNWIPCRLNSICFESRAWWQGAGIMVQRGRVIFVNATISNNTADHRGGGMDITGGFAVLSNGTRIASNHAPTANKSSSAAAAS